MNPTSKKALISALSVAACVVLVVAVVLGLVIYSVVSNLNTNESGFELADVSKPVGIVSYVENNTLTGREYADVFPASVTAAQTELLSVPQKQENVKNVLAICTDVQNGNTVADMLIVISMNEQTGEIRMLSLGGDTYVPIDGHGWDKLSTTIAYGGPCLAVNTVNRVFDLDISQYVMISKQDVQGFFEQIAPLEVEMSVRQAEMFANYFGWDVHPGLNELDAEQLSTMVSFRDYADGVSINGELVLISDADRMENIKMVARAVFRSLFKLDSATVGATLDMMWNKLDTNCDLGTVKTGIQTVVASKQDDGLGLNASSLPALNPPTYVLVQPEGYEQPAMATLYNYIALRTQIEYLLYGAGDH